MVFLSKIRVFYSELQNFKFGFIRDPKNKQKTGITRNPANPAKADKTKQTDCLHMESWIWCVWGSEKCAGTRYETVPRSFTGSGHRKLSGTRVSLFGDFLKSHFLTEYIQIGPRNSLKARVLAESNKLFPHK